MAKRSLGGAKYFEALGRHDTSLGISALVRSPQRKNWPSWADKAYMRGRILQMEIPKGVITVGGHEIKPMGRETYQFSDPVETVK